MNDTDEQVVPVTGSTSETIVIKSMRNTLSEHGLAFSNLDFDRMDAFVKDAIEKTSNATGVSAERIIEIMKSCVPQPHSD